MNTATKNLTALNYFGGKSRYLDWLLPMFPPHKVYCEPFCGSASVFLNKEPSPIKCINDIDSRVINFFRVLREQPAELIALLELTPYSRNEFQFANDISPDPVEDARRYFVRALQSFGGQTNNTRRVNSWRVNISNSRRGMALDNAKWLSKIEGLISVVARLKQAQIDNRSFENIIPRYDRVNTFFFCDPPYIHSTRTGKDDYDFEMSLDQHREMCLLLRKVKGKVMICGYNNPYYAIWLCGWYKVIGPERCTNLGKKKGQQREMVWCNYNPDKIPKLFGPEHY